MATCADMLADLRDRLEDAGDTKWSEATKIRYLNHGQKAMFPKIFQTTRDATLVLATSTFEYNIPSAVGSNSIIVSIEVEDSGSRYHPLDRYDIITGLTDPILRLSGLSLPGPVGANIRITAAKPLTAFTTSASTYTGPTISEELPVLYAMGLCMSGDVERRLNLRRMPTVEGVTTADDWMTASQLWLSRFDQLLEQLRMPLPSAL